MHVRARNWLGQFSTLRLERVDGTVGGTVDRSMSGRKGVVVAERAGTKCGWVADRCSANGGERTLVFPPRSPLRRAC
jgi:hypothetical protein